MAGADGTGPAVAYPALVDLVKNGERVRAETPNRPLRQLADRAQHLKNRLDVSQLGETLFVFDVPIDAEKGEVVYFNAETKKYEKALAAAETDTVSGVFDITDSSFVIGIVHAKTSATRGNLATNGLLRGFDLTNTIDGDPTESGPYYLSTQKPGKLTRQKPPISLFVLFNRGDSCAHFQPDQRDFLESHIHFRFNLFAQPAGTHNCVDFGDGLVHTIVTSDPDLPGWLPADHPIFNGAAPADAKFGYNFSQHPELQKVFPPIPVESVFIDRNGIGVDLESECPEAVVDRNGLWWFKNCFGAAPWPPDFPDCIVESPSSPSPSSPASPSSPSSPAAPCDCLTPLDYLPGHGTDRLDKMFLRLWFTRMVFKTDQSVVTRLKPCAGSPIKVLSCDELVDAETGDLCLDLDLNFAVDENIAGFQVLKNIIGSTFKRGPVTEGLRAGANVSISAAEQGALFDAKNNLWHGNLVLDFIAPGSLFQEGQADLIALDDVRKDLVKDDPGDEGVFVLVFPGGRDSQIRGRVELPNSGLPTNSVLKIRTRVMGSLSGVVLPVFEHSFRRIPRNVDPCTPLALPLADTVLADVAPCAGQALDANEYVEAEGAAFSVANGDTVFFTLRRLGATDGYGGDVSALRVEYRIDAG